MKEIIEAFYLNTTDWLFFCQLAKFFLKIFCKFFFFYPQFIELKLEKKANNTARISYFRIIYVLHSFCLFFNSLEPLYLLPEFSHDLSFQIRVVYFREDAHPKSILNPLLFLWPRHRTMNFSTKKSHYINKLNQSSQKKRRKISNWYNQFWKFCS